MDTIERGRQCCDNFRDIKRGGGGHKFGHYGRKAGRQSRSHDNQKYQES